MAKEADGNESNASRRRSPFHPTIFKDIAFLKQCIANKTYEKVKGERNVIAIWDATADKLVAHDCILFKGLTGRYLRGRIETIVKQYKKANSDALKKSGEQETWDELDQLANDYMGLVSFVTFAAFLFQLT